MKIKKYIVSMVLFLAAVASMAGCAPKIADTSYALRYPGYPREPRIAYLKSYYGAGDETFSSFFEILLGTSKSELMLKPFQAVMVQDTLYVTLAQEKGVGVIDTLKHTFSIITHFGDTTLKSVRGLAVSSAGDIYVCDPAAHSLYVADRNFMLKQSIGRENKLFSPFAVALDEKRDRLYVIDQESKSLKAFTTAGAFLFEFGKDDVAGQADKKSDDKVEPKGYFGIAVDKRNGRIVASDTPNFEISVFDDRGNLVLKFGKAGDNPEDFGMLRGVSVNSEGHIYASDAMFNAISLFNEEGKILMRFGGFGTEPGKFQNPLEISFDDRDRLYVADSLAGRVQVFQYLSDQWKKDHPEEYAKYLKEPPATQQAVKQKLKSVPVTH